MLEWINTNREWLFSGLGITVLTGILTAAVKYLTKRNNTPTTPLPQQTQKSGMLSKNIQIGSISITNNGDK